jgi:methylated-DNA-[protein]-cysteine S-methyltransferase
MAKIVLYPACLIIFSMIPFSDRIFLERKTVNNKSLFHVRYWQLVSTVIKGEIMPKITGHLQTVYFTSFETDFGWIRPISNGQSLIRLDWNQTGWEDSDLPDNVSRETQRQIIAFFAGHLHQFNLPLAPAGKSAGGKKWLAVMASIPYGTVMTYGEFAASAGKPKAARAAGSVCASNPIPIIYPCHRVVRADGCLGNYGGGSGHHPTHLDNLTRKGDLLRFEANSAANAA